MTNTSATIDIVQLTGSGKQSGKAVTVTASCELMHNQLPASAIDPSKNILAVQDSSGSPLLFSIGSDQRLWLMSQDSASPGGWAALELTAGMDQYTSATCLDLSQDRQGHISVAFAMRRKDGSGTDVLYATMVPNDTTAADWKAFATLAKPLQGLDPAFAATQLILGHSDDGDAPLLSVAGVIGAQQHYYVLTDPAAPAVLMNFPEDLGKDPAALIALANGYAFGQRGIWFLYTLGQSQTLECTTFSDPSLGSMMYDYSPPSGILYTCMALPTGAYDDPMSISSDVYVGTNSGVSMFRGASKEQFETVAADLPDVHQIIVRTEGEKVSVWAICSPNLLYYISGKAGVANSWNTPVLFSTDCLHLAPIRSTSNSANELFIVSNDPSTVRPELIIVHAIQDPVSTLWHKETIKQSNKDLVCNAQTYTSVLQFEDDAGTPMAGQTVGLTASDWVYATVNGKVYSLDLDTPVMVRADAAGKVTVIVQAADISTPILHVSSDSFVEVVNCYPNGRVYQGLGNIKTGADLKAATADGKPVLDPGTDDATADGVASNVSQMQTAGSQYVDGARAPGAVYLAIGPTRHSGALDLSHLPANFAIGMQRMKGTWQPLAVGSHAHVLTMTNGFDDILMDIGDALEWLGHTMMDGLEDIVKGITYLKDGATFILHKVGDVLNFVFTLAGKVLTIALKTFGALLKALNFVLKLVGIDLAKILAWLGHLLGWDTIWDTHKIIAAMLNNSLLYAEKAVVQDIDAVRNAVSTVLANIKQDFDGLSLPAEVAAPRKTDSGMPAGAQHSAPANMATYQMQHGGMLNGSGAASSGAPSLTDLATNLLPELMSAVIGDLTKLANDAVALCTQPGNTIDSVRQILADLIDMLLEVLNKLITAFFNVVAALVTAISEGLREEADIPLLSQFYEFITDLLGDEEEFSVINATALLLAIPLVEMSRAFGLGAPFDGVDGMDSPDLFNQIEAHNRNPVAQRMMAATLKDDPPEGVSKMQHDYSTRGGIVGAIVSIFETIGQLLTSADESSGGPGEGTKATIEKVVLAMSLVRFAATFPIRDPARDEHAWRLKVTAWVIALTGILLTLGLKQVESINAEEEGAIGAVTNGLTLVLQMISDGIGKEAEALAWCSDIAGGLGGLASGIGAATKDPYVAAVGLGTGGLGSIFALALAVKTAPDQVAYFVNVGG